MKDMKMKKPNMPSFASRSTMGPVGASRSTMGPVGMAKPGMAMPQFASRAMRPGGMAKGGKIHEDAAMDKKLIRKEIARAEKMEEKSEKKEMKKGGMVKKMARGGGVESKGKTKGRFV